jgi:hypothetical protein
MSDDFVLLPLPRLVDASGGQAAAALERARREAAIVDARLSTQVTLAFKGSALADLCEKLRADTGIRLSAGASVADEKVTLLCKEMPLRDVMRQLSRPFGYAWTRSGKDGEYRYELIQDLRSQLLEEELRNRDRNAALLALDRQMQRYRQYLDLSPDEALARSKTAPEVEKKLLQQLGGKGWGPIQVYFRLSPADLAALRAGQTLVFSELPKSGENPLPAGLGRGVLTCLRDIYLVPRGGGYDFSHDRSQPGRIPISAFPEARARVRLSLDESELGRYTLEGASGFLTANPPEGPGGFMNDGPLAVGTSDEVAPKNQPVVDARIADEPALKSRVTLQPKPSCSSHSPEGAGGNLKEAKVTTADLLEAVHHATGLPIVADYYTRLYPADTVTVRNQPLAAALGRVCKTMRLRWSRSGDWLQLRSKTFYDDRMKEVPNRLLDEWSASRRQQGALSLDDLIEIAGLTDAQLDAAEMAEGARECFGLVEWDLARHRGVRRDWRFLAQLTPAQRRQAQSRAGLPFTGLSRAQQQQFIAVVAGPTDLDLPSLEEFAQGTLRIAYTQPGGYEWRRPEAPLWRQQMGPPDAYAPTREAALREARQIDPAAAVETILPAKLSVSLLYFCGTEPGGYVRVLRNGPKGVGAYEGRPDR